ncbi:DUF4307 domain-containing protein [Mumia sp. zg.B53]|uniref:DUF4307 domain-containing protein n=1 Tax=unclassified Mumia TaxID=2621872 RepID=UPI001C6E8686|nr:MULTISPECIES: DUF4307 domain-containing protein [unclassified Mumia]MBW9206880.1 DUF4307 domain-containing protein [Mumia sp. zg.B17]MBW9210833.1 DUF4307 domain-containing protein [Mumia sp. zg.B21]MBW9215398.1 DUF4307 domain-containing protein [Mumia sp. zg.B53]MDD9349074.1 DUF4307 domain-containing protein [Mumia sp.]
MPVTDPALSTSRYGERRTLSRRTWTVIAAVGVTLGVIAAWFVAQAQAGDSFQADVVAYKVLSDHEISVTVRVLHPSGDPALCEVAAQAEDHSYVGEATIRVDRTDTDEIQVRDVVATERRAVTATVVSCRLAD